MGGRGNARATRTAVRMRAIHAAVHYWGTRSPPNKRPPIPKPYYFRRYKITVSIYRYRRAGRGVGVRRVRAHVLRWGQHHQAPWSKTRCRHCFVR